jgi:antitoxin component YwqK of YwqJK toxin-antitoxin module
MARENGIIREFDERGRVRLKYTAKNGQKTGLVTIYTYIDDFADSASIEATADVASSVRMEECGQMLNGERPGHLEGDDYSKWQVYKDVSGVQLC